MVQLDCEGLQQGLANKAKSYADILLKKLATDHHNENLEWVSSRGSCRPALKSLRLFLTKLFVPVQRIYSEFETIRDDALATPENIDDMARIIAHIESSRTKRVPELTQRIRVPTKICYFDFIS